MSATTLTAKQLSVLEFIEDYIRSNGHGPTNRVLCDHFGWSSYGTPQKFLKTLQRKGWIAVEHNRVGGISIVRPSIVARRIPAVDDPGESLPVRLIARAVEPNLLDLGEVLMNEVGRDNSWGLTPGTFVFVTIERVQETDNDT